MACRAGVAIETINTQGSLGGLLVSKGDVMADRENYNSQPRLRSDVRSTPAPAPAKRPQWSDTKKAKAKTVGKGQNREVAARSPSWVRESPLSAMSYGSWEEPIPMTTSSRSGRLQQEDTVGAEDRSVCSGPGCRTAARAAPGRRHRLAADLAARVGPQNCLLPWVGELTPIDHTSAPNPSTLIDLGVSGLRALRISACARMSI